MIDEAALDRAVRRCPWVMTFARANVHADLCRIVVDFNRAMVVRFYRQELESTRHDRVSLLDARQGSGV